MTVALALQTLLAVQAATAIKMSRVTVHWWLSLHMQSRLLHRGLWRVLASLHAVSSFLLALVFFDVYPSRSVPKIWVAAAQNPSLSGFM